MCFIVIQSYFTKIFAKQYEFMVNSKKPPRKLMILGVLVNEKGDFNAGQILSDFACVFGRLKGVTN